MTGAVRLAFALRGLQPYLRDLTDAMSRCAYHAERAGRAFRRAARTLQPARNLSARPRRNRVVRR